MFDIEKYPNSEKFYDQTVMGKIVAIGQPFTIAGVITLKVNNI